MGDPIIPKAGVAPPGAPVLRSPYAAGKASVGGSSSQGSGQATPMTGRSAGGEGGGGAAGREATTPGGGAFPAAAGLDGNGPLLGELGGRGSGEEGGSGRSITSARLAEADTAGAASPTPLQMPIPTMGAAAIRGGWRSPSLAPAMAGASAAAAAAAAAAGAAATLTATAASANPSTFSGLSGAAGAEAEKAEAEEEVLEEEDPAEKAGREALEALASQLVKGLLCTRHSSGFFGVNSSRCVLYLERQQQMHSMGWVLSPVLSWAKAPSNFTSHMPMQAALQALQKLKADGSRPLDAIHSLGTGPQSSPVLQKLKDKEAAQSLTWNILFDGAGSSTLSLDLQADTHSQRDMFLLGFQKAAEDPEALLAMAQSFI